MWRYRSVNKIQYVVYLHRSMTILCVGVTDLVGESLPPYVHCFVQVDCMGNEFTA